MAKTRKTTSNYKIPFSGEKRTKTQRLIRQSVKSGKSPQEIYDKLKTAGLGYRKQNALADIRLKYATINAKSPQARKRSETWFLNVFEPMRKENKLNSKQARKLYDMAVNESYKTSTQARRGKQIRLNYRNKFKIAPRNRKILDDDTNKEW